MIKQNQLLMYWIVLILPTTFQMVNKMGLINLFMKDCCNWIRIQSTIIVLQNDWLIFICSVQFISIFMTSDYERQQGTLRSTAPHMYKICVWFSLEPFEFNLKFVTASLVHDRYYPKLSVHHGGHYHTYTVLLLITLNVLLVP